jgi:hypothetical protein
MLNRDANKYNIYDSEAMQVKLANALLEAASNWMSCFRN